MFEFYISQIIMIKKLAFLIVFSTLNIIVFSNNTDAERYEDSIVNAVIHENDIDKKMEGYIVLIEFYQQNSFSKAFEYCKIGINTAKKNNLKEHEYLLRLEQISTLLLSGEISLGIKKLDDLSSEILTYNNDRVLGHYFLTRNSIAHNDLLINKSLEDGLLALRYFKNAADTLGIARAYNSIGIVYDGIGNQQKALDYYLLAIDFAQKVDYKWGLNSTYNNIGVLYNDLGDPSHALYYYEKALDLSYKTFDKLSIAGELNNIALIYYNEKKYKEALSYLHRGLTITREMNYKVDEALISSNLGQIYRELKKYDSSSYYLNSAIKLYEFLEDNYNIANNAFELGALFEDLNEREKAKEQYHKIIELLRDNPYDKLVEETYEKLSNLSKDENDFVTAYNYMYKAKLVSDSVGKLSVSEKLTYAQLQIDFKNKISDYKDEILNTERVYSISLKHEKKSKLISILISIMFFASSLLIFVRFKRSDRSNDLLVKHNKEIQHQKSLMEITNIELKEQYAFTRTLLNTIPSPVFYTNKKGMIIGFNKAFENLIGINEEELIGENIIDLHKKNSFKCELLNDFVDVVELQYTKEGTLITSANETHDIIFNKVGIVEEDLLIGLLGVIIDVTQIRDVERSLQNSKQKLKEAINAKDKFFSIMTHDLKNPFNAVLGLTHLIAENFDSYDGAEVKRYAKLINESANRIYNLLENLLEWSSAQSGTLVKNPVIFNINEPIDECLNLLDNSISQKQIQIDFNSSNEIVVFVDKNMILTVIRNILINAIKYTPHKGKITITTRVIKNKLKLTIADTGIGISQNSISKLFKKDQPISTPGLMNEMGTGLGLIISREFLDLNNGEIEVQSEEDKGSSFIITLPIHKH